jgi:hypothetical protein
MITENELYDAMTTYVKNDWRKVWEKTKKMPPTRSDGIQVGKSGWYLISESNWNLIIYKLDKDYDLSNFQWDWISAQRGRGENWNSHYNFKISEVKTVKDRKKVCAMVSKMMNRKGYEPLEEIEREITRDG